MELENSLENNTEIEIVNSEKQNTFLESTLGKTINAAIDIGLRWVLPDIIEDEVIKIKDSLLKDGLKEGINTAINTAIDIGKGALGIFTGKFENISQAQSAIKTGGIIDGVSDAIDFTLQKVNEKGILNNTITNVIKQGKDVILENVSKNIEKEFTRQLEGVEQLETYENNWKEFYENKDFPGMEKEYQKIQEKLKELMPVENTLKEARIIENLHNIIQNNGHNFNLSNEQLELAKMLS